MESHQRKSDSVPENSLPKKNTKKMKKQAKQLQKDKVKESEICELKSILKNCRLSPEIVEDLKDSPDEDGCYASSYISKYPPKKSKGHNINIVKFNNQVIVINIAGGKHGVEVLGKSCEELCKEDDQQARNIKLRENAP